MNHIPREKVIIETKLEEILRINSYLVTRLWSQTTHLLLPLVVIDLFRLGIHSASVTLDWTPTYLSLFLLECRLQIRLFCHQRKGKSRRIGAVLSRIEWHGHKLRGHLD